MLICPHCQFENPNTNNFCQRCGTSLTHKTCHECDTQVPLDAATCQNCGAFTGTVWQAIVCQESVFPESLEVDSEKAPQEVLPIEVSKDTQTEISPQEASPPRITANSTSSSVLSPKESDNDNAEVNAPTPSVKSLVEDSLDESVTQLSSSSPSESNLLSTKEQSTVSDSESESESERQIQSSSPQATVIYLDPQQRYLLLEPETLQKTRNSRASSNGGETHDCETLRVLDSQPFQQSPLEALMAQQGCLPRWELLENQPATAQSDAWQVFGIPVIARPYLSLRESYYPTLPEVHDTWQHNGEIVVLLEDRSRWLLLSEFNSEELSPLQNLYWLDEMAKLWEALEPLRYRQTLLEITNLRVDEDQVLGLVRLYPEAKEQQLTLQDLGKMWQRLFDQSESRQFNFLETIYQQLSTNKIVTIKELRSLLEKLARELQTTNSRGQFSDPEEEESALVNPDLKAVNLQGESGDELPTVVLPMQLLSLDDAGCSDIGNQREHNEDYFGIQTAIKKEENPAQRMLHARGLYILCDGMGGHAAGEVASAMAVEAVKQYFQENWSEELPNEESIREAVRLANQVIYDVNQQNACSGSARMGTTLAMVLIQDTNAAIAHVGDSRVYRLTRKRGLEQVSVDHEVGQREIQRGVEPAIAYSRPDAYQLTQALGPRSDEFVNPDVQFLELNEDSLFVLCSDGLSDNELVENHWQTHLAPLLSSRANLEQGMLKLIALGNEYNGHDNITVLLIRAKVRPNFEQQKRF
ncbi:serine/threonine phosphatase [Lyngbya aestuarii]|uniref:serine/threonine phosphatase n=1 Tax=Lyngbya aestuarii TaxID=118322 RepID=UPI00403E1A33